MKGEYNGQPIMDLISVTWQSMPLPYFNVIWLPHKLVPFFLAECRKDEASCKLLDFMKWCFENQSRYSGAKDSSYNQLLDQLASEVSKALVYEKQTLVDALNSSANELETRYAYKFATANSVYAAPLVKLNGVELNALPPNVEGWRALLDELITNQDLSNQAASFLN